MILGGNVGDRRWRHGRDGFEAFVAEIMCCGHVR
jgi:hypothetical protein